MVALFAKVNPPLGKFGVWGDVDLTMDTSGTGNPPLVLLRDESVEIPWEGRKIRIHGLSCEGSRNPNTDVIEQWLQRSSPGDIDILLGHAPDYILSLSEQPIDLCLAGHTHGGQVRVPFYGPIFTLSNVSRDLALGLNEVGNTRLNVSGGVGSEHCAGIPAIRFNCPSEMSLIEVSAAE